LGRLWNSGQDIIPKSKSNRCHLIVCIVTVIWNRRAKWHNHHGVSHRLLVRPHDILLEPVSKYLHLRYTSSTVFLGERNSNVPERSLIQQARNIDMSSCSPPLPHVRPHKRRLAELFKVITPELIKSMVCILIHGPHGALFASAPDTQNSKNHRPTISRYSSSDLPRASSEGLDSHVLMMLIGVRLTPGKFSSTVVKASLMAPCSASACGKKSKRVEQALNKAGHTLLLTLIKVNKYNIIKYDLQSQATKLARRLSESSTFIRPAALFFETGTVV